MEKTIKKKKGSNDLVEYKMNYFLEEGRLRIVNIEINSETECAIVFDEDSQEFKIHIQPFAVSYDDFTFEKLFKSAGNLSNYLYGLEKEVEYSLKEYIEGAKEMVEAVSFLNNEINKLKSEEL